MLLIVLMYDINTMNIVDLIIIAIIIFAVIRWVKSGLVQGLFSLLGVIIGLLVGALVAPYVMKFFETPFTRFSGAVLIIVLCLVLFDTLFEYVGYKLSNFIVKPWAIKTNAILGGVFGVFFSIVFVWLMAAMLMGSPSAQFNEQIQNSSIIKALDSRLPPTPPLLARINGLITPLEFPQVFVGGPPKLTEPVAPTGSVDIQAAVKNAGRSTVRIGAPGCGGILYGSGYVVAQNLVMTNAHVLAGTKGVTVEDTNGQHKATVVYFNPDLDVAVLRTSGLAGAPLKLEDSIKSRGTAAVVLGYPGGGNFKAVSASVLRNLNAVGLNIYGSSMAPRNIYEIQTNIVPGNSGGPVVLPDGTVIGMVFASSDSGQAIGYGITSPALKSIVAETVNSFGSVSTQVCSKR